MFLDFFLLLKNDGFPVTLKEYLTFLEALDRDVIGYDSTDFYYLARCVMVKDERHLDRFDRLFSAYFRGAQLADTEQFMQIPLEWLRKNFENVLSEEDKEMIRSMGGLEETDGEAERDFREAEKTPPGRKQMDRHWRHFALRSLRLQPGRGSHRTGWQQAETGC